MIIDICPECGTELKVTCLLTYPAQRKYKCDNCGFKHIKKDKVEKVVLKPLELNREGETK